jgi:hypothetical protein
MQMKLLSSVALAASMALAIGSTAHAGDVITNGDFSSSTYGATNSQFGTGFGGQGVTGWTGNGGYNIYFGTNVTTNAASQYSPPSTGEHFRADVFPTDGAFVALDGDTGVKGMISQDLTGLEVGKNYTLSFDWAAGQLANRTGDITEMLTVSFGGQSFDTGVLSVPSTLFSGWNHVTYVFTASQANQTLSFLSVGTPNGLPPMALLDNVSLTVPEPATWAMMLIGFGGIGAMIRHRRQVLATA